MAVWYAKTRPEVPDPPQFPSGKNFALRYFARSPPSLRCGPTFSTQRAPRFSQVLCLVLGKIWSDRCRSKKCARVNRVISNGGQDARMRQPLKAASFRNIRSRFVQIGVGEM
jgi:hypothetical protein